MLDNFFANMPPANTDAEQFITLLAEPGLRVERIVSTGQSSPPGFWYEQAEAEWILLLQGDAGLRFEDESTARHLIPGTFLDIAPGRRHRVEWTASDQSTIWLAIHRTPSTG